MGNLSELISNRLREIRKQKGLRQEDMEKYGLNYKYYQRVESGRVNITLSTIEKIAEALDIRPEELFVFPLSDSEEAERLVASIGRIIKNNDSKMIKKINLIIEEVLS